MSKVTNNKLAILALAGLGAIATGPAFADSMTVDSKGGLEIFQNNSTDYWFRLGGRLMLDQAWFDVGDSIQASNFPSGAQIRDTRVTFKGGVGSHWVYKLDLNFVDAAGNGGGSRFGEAWLGYETGKDACNPFFFALGQVSIPFGLENWASASYTPLMEYSLPSNAFSPNNGLGIYGEWHGQMLTFAGAIYHPNGAGTRQTGDVIASPPVVAGVIQRGSGPFGSAPGSDTLGGAARLTFSPVHDSYTVYHAGLSGRYEDLHNEANGYDFYTGMEVRARQTPVLFTNIPPNSVQDIQVYGAELAGRWGPFILQGEYMWAYADRESSYPVGDLRNPPGNQQYNGYYVLASYVLTGETKEYDFDSGVFGAVHPKCPTGAWEIVIRYSFVDLLDNQQFASNPYFFFVDFPTNRFSNFVESADMVGSAHATTVGLTWWVNDNVRFLANYNRTSLPGDFSVSILGLRGQVTW
jgi:phosphate-selective porin OprO/OprP